MMRTSVFWSVDDEDEEEEEMDSSELAEYVSPAQLDQHLITLSLLPDSRWKNLLHLDIIKVSLSFCVCVCVCECFSLLHTV